MRSEPPTETDLPKIKTELVSAQEMMRLEKERREQNTPEARAARIVEQWFYAGLKAYLDGKKRTDYPFKKALRRNGLDGAWQTGWDTGAMGAAIGEGTAAKPGDRNPYTDPELAACWTRGWNARHGLAVVGGTKNPAPRPRDARPGHS